MGESSSRESPGRILPDCSAPGAAGVGGKRPLPLPRLVSLSALPSAAASQRVSCALACASSAAAPTRSPESSGNGVGPII